MKPRRVTDAIDARLEQVARMKADTPTFKELEKETGLTAGYLRQIVSAKVQLITNKRDDSCGTNAG